MSAAAGGRRSGLRSPGRGLSAGTSCPLPAEPALAGTAGAVPCSKERLIQVREDAAACRIRDEQSHRQKSKSSAGTSGLTSASTPSHILHAAVNISIQPSPPETSV